MAIQDMLLQQADEIADAGLKGWGNTMRDAAAEIARLTAELAAGKLMADFAKGAISDAIYTDYGLDGETGQRVLKIITEWQTRGTFDSALCDTLTGFETMLTKELTASQERERVLRAFVAAWDAWHSAKRESPDLFAAVCAAREAVGPLGG